MDVTGYDASVSLQMVEAVEGLVGGGSPNAVSEQPFVGDFHPDGRINSLDLLEFSRYWHAAPAGSASKADLDTNGTVDEDDLLRLIEARHWQKATP